MSSTVKRSSRAKLRGADRVASAPPPDVDSDDDVGGFPMIEERGVTEFPKDDPRKMKKKKKGTQGGFQSMGLVLPVLRGVLNKGYRVPTPIQRKAIPVIMQGGDVVAMARTGSGKTASFLVPMLQQLKAHSAKVGARGLILSPTRELAMQTMRFCADLGKYTDLRACVIVGGDSMDEQFSELARNPDMCGELLLAGIRQLTACSIVATPGRLLHHLVQIGMTLNMVEYVVFDEADRLFEMGFADQLKQIMSRVSVNRQTVLVSATMPKMLVDFAAAGLRNPKLIRLDIESKISENLKLAYFTCRAEDKIAALLYLLTEFIVEGEPTVVFVATKHLGEFLRDLLRDYGTRSVTIYGAMDGPTRKFNLNLFKTGKVNLMIVTDLAARGIDIPLLDNVINFDFPGKPKLFIHRVGRVARAGRSGCAYTLVSPEEMPYMVDLHLFLGKKLKTTGDEAYGRIPTDVLDRYSETARRIVATNVELSLQEKTVKNAYKLYYRTRPSPSPESVARSKELAPPSIHPQLIHEVADDDGKRLDFLSAMKNFRPNQTILELRAKNKNIPQEKTIRSRLGAAEGKAAATNILNIMKTKRYIHGGAIVQKQQKKDLRKAREAAAGQPEEEDVVVTEFGAVPAVPEDEAAEEVSRPRGKRKRKRKRRDEAAAAAGGSNLPPSKKQKKANDFKDPEFFLSYEPSDKDTEAGMSVKDNSFQRSIVDEVLDMIPDERDEIMKNRQRKMWDRKRMRYVQVTGNVDPDNVSKSTKIRNESGQLVDGKKKKSFYQEWTKKSKLIVQKEGELEQDVAKNATTLAAWRMKRHQHTKGSEKGSGPGAASELKSSEQIVKERRVKRKNISKNKKKMRMQRR